MRTPLSTSGQERKFERVRLVVQRGPGQEWLAKAMLLKRNARVKTITQILDYAYLTSQVDALAVNDAQERIIHRAQEPERKGDFATAWGIE